MDRMQLGVEASFCKLRNMLCASGGCKLAIIARCCTAWGKFKQLKPILTFKHASFTTSGKVQCLVWLTLLHKSETRMPSAQTCIVFVKMTEPWFDGFAASNPITKSQWTHCMKSCGYRRKLPYAQVSEMVWAYLTCVLMYQLGHRYERSKLQRTR